MNPTAIASAAVALAAGWLAGAPLWALTVAGLAWTATWFAPPTPRILLLIATPVVLIASIRTTAFDTTLALTALAGIASIIPLITALGKPQASIRMLAPLGAALIAATFFLTPAGAILLASDLATGALIVAFAAGLLITTSIPRT